jgi:Sulfite reductase, beta subunit (hemoprotein)
MATAKETPTLELVLKRNSVERLKREKSPLGILEELPALIAGGYEQVPEEDIVRLKWWGLYHDKPKIGTFMLRIKLAGGIASPAQLRAIGEISNVHGRGEGELTTRQNVQLHFLELGALPDVFARLEAAGLTSAGAAATRCATSPAAPWPGSPTTSCSTRRRSSRSWPPSSTATRRTPTCRVSTRSPSPPA